MLVWPVFQVMVKAPLCGGTTPCRQPASSTAEPVGLAEVMAGWLAETQLLY